MSETTNETSAQPTPGAPESTTDATSTTTPEGKQPPWGAPENFDAEMAWKTIQNLRKEKSQPDPQLKQEVDALKQAQEQQRNKLAEALGLTEPPKNEDALAETVKNLQQQFAASQLEATRLRIAANPGVDAEGKPLPAIPPDYHDLLTETDPEKLKAQAEKVAALVAARGQSPEAPQFQPNPGQGQGGSTSAQAQAEAEYQQYYPESQSGK